MWGYNWDNGEEFEIVFPGIGGGNISYITNQYLNLDSDASFDELVVVTQSGDNYTLYIYKGSDLSGGQPKTNAKPQIVEGHGKVKCVRFVSPLDLSGDLVGAFETVLPYWD